MFYFDFKNLVNCNFKLKQVYMICICKKAQNVDVIRCAFFSFRITACHVSMSSFIIYYVNLLYNFE